MEIIVNIAPIREKDLESLAGLYQQLFPNRPDYDKMKETLLHLDKDPNHIILGAREDGQLVGSLVGVVCGILFGKCKPFMVVEDVVIDNNLRRAGIGKGLMTELERFAVSRECSYIILLTDSDRPEAHRFYESLGYQSDPYRGFKKSLASNC
jgi:ribosomal protein S18 acetylase RimI-like enzyme